MKEMTSRERLLAAVRFQGPDRVPVSPRMWRYMLRHGGSQGIHAYLKYAEEFGVDPLLQAAAGPVIMFPQPGSDYCCLPRPSGWKRVSAPRRTTPQSIDSAVRDAVTAAAT